MRSRRVQKKRAGGARGRGAKDGERGTSRRREEVRAKERKEKKMRIHCMRRVTCGDRTHGGSESTTDHTCAPPEGGVEFSDQSDRWPERHRGRRGERDRRRRREKGTRNSSGRAAAASASPLRSWSGLCILRLAPRCLISTSLLWKTHVATQLLPVRRLQKTCSDSFLNKKQPVVELGFHSSAVEDGPNQCAIFLRGRPLEHEQCQWVWVLFQLQF